MLSPYLLGPRGPGAYAGGEGDPGFPEPPIVTDVDGDVSVNGKVKPGSFGKFVYPLATVTAGRRYTIRVVASFAQLARQGDLAMVGFGFKTDNDFHITGLRGDGAGGTDEYIVHGTSPNGWNKQTGHTEVDGGAAAAGTQFSAYYRLTVSSDGTTYTLETDTDGTSYATAFTAQAPTPFTNVSQVTTFGVALWFNNLDAGPFSVQVTEFVDEEASTNDPFIANVVLLVNPAGADASTTITDASPAANGNATVTGSAQIDTGVTDGGNPTIMMASASSDGVKWADDADWFFGSGDWAIEGRFRFSSLASDMGLISQWSGTNQSWFLGFTTSGGNALLAQIRTALPTDTTIIMNIPWSPSTDTWYDIAMNYDGNVLRAFIDGVMVDSETIGAVTLVDSIRTCAIGGIHTAGASVLNGHIGRVRITKGNDRGWGDAGYTPQAAGYFPTS